MKLLEGLKQGLDRNVDDMKKDGEILMRKEKLLGQVVPGLVQKHAYLETEFDHLQQVVEEMENCDQEELRKAREKLIATDNEISERKRELANLQPEFQEKTDAVEAGTARKSDLLGQIRDAEQVIEECRGWSVKEVHSLKGECSIRSRNIVYVR